MASDVNDETETKNISDENQDPNNQDPKIKNKSHAYYWLV